jgi:PAS domain S-box-containing protein
MSQAPQSHRDRWPQMAAYDLTERIHEGPNTVVYRGRRRADALPVVLKRLKSNFPSIYDLLHLRNHYTLAKNLPEPGITAPLSLEPDGHGFVLVMPDEGYQALSNYRIAHPLALSEVLAIAIQLTDILHYLYQHRVIHKDIKPANILIHPESQQIQLTDFSIASLLPKETEKVKHPNVLEGTLAYLAPEQTGRMNRGIDYRTDFYSLGVTLFELLAGELPFQSDDPLELVHGHLAQPTPSVCTVNPEVPPVIGQIVTKLMAKNAEDRYQSALGLKYDLERVLHQLNTTGTIAPFELATRDVSDRFVIPEKLYGREAEVQALLAAFDRVSQGTSELMLVAGYSGIGKTAVVNEVHKPMTRQRGYFIKGKFDQFNRNIPFSAFVQAFRDLIGQLLSESDAQLQRWKRQILAAVGENGQVMIDVIPELERIIGPQPTIPELSGAAAQNRFNFVFQKFIQVFTTPDHPLVMFLDDLQWIDSASLRLMQLLMAEAENGYLLLMGAYRDNEVSPVHPLMVTLETLSKAGTLMRTITLAPLAPNSLNQLVSDTLNCAKALAQPLTELVYQKTQGNPFFATQFLKALHQDRLIEFDRQAGYWQCDIVQVQAAALTDDVVEFMALQLQKLPATTQAVLKLAACMGNQFNLETLAIVSEQSEIETATALWAALREGLILPFSQIYKFFQAESKDITQGVDIRERRAAAQQDKTAAAWSPEPESCTYRFLHDRVQQAAYSLIPESSKQSIHHHIGQLLLQKIPANQREAKIFDLVNQLNMGITQVEQLTEREELAQLNLLAAQKAKAATAYAAALDYATTGIRLLPSTSWRDRYSLTRQLHEIAAKAAYLTGDLKQMADWVAIVRQQAHTLLDQIEVIELMIQSYAVRNQHREAIDLALETLAQLGVHIPKSPRPEQVQQEFRTVREIVSAYSMDDLLNLPPMTDRDKLAASQILANMSGFLSVGAPALLPITVLQQVRIYLEYGNSSFSAHGYVCFGILGNSFFQDSEAGYQFGQLALGLIERANTHILDAKIFQLVGAYTIHYQYHVSETLPFFDRAYVSGLENGDLEFTGYSVMTKCQYLYFLSQELTELDQIMAEYNNSLIKLQQTASLSWNQVCHQAVLNLIYPTENPCCLTSDCFDEDNFLEWHLTAQAGLGLHYFYNHKLILCILFEDYEQGLENAQQAELYLASADGFLHVPIFYFYESLVHLQRWFTVDEEERPQWLEKVNGNQQKMRLWADHAPMNYQHKWELVEAETYRVLGQPLAAMESYDRAIAGAKENGFLQEEALANELAAKFYLDWGKNKIAATYMQEAYYGYSHWGANAKVANLEIRYPELLNAILKSSATTIDMLANLTTTAASEPSGQSKIRHSSGRPTLSQTFDFASILKASQALSRTLHFDELLRQLIQIILQYSGGDRCVLILPNDAGEWQVRAIVTSQETHLCDESLTTATQIPLKLIHYVKNTQEIVVINNLETDLPVIDDYLRQRHPQSILCLPILHQGRCIGILDLKNDITRGVFTDDRITILNFLCTQAAISLENARLFAARQRAEADLQRQNSFLKAQQESSTDGLLVVDANRQIRFYNQRFVSLWNIPEALLATEDDRQLLVWVLDQLKNPTEFLTKIEYLYDHPEESSFDEIELKGQRFLERYSSPVRLPSGEYASRIWYFRDISDRKRNEKILQQQLAAIEASSDGVAIANAQGEYTYINQAHVQIFGYEQAEELLGKTWRELYETSDVEWFEQEIFPLLMQNRTWQGETIGKRKDGSRFFEEISLTLLPDDRIICICRDISDRKTLEAEKQRQLAILETTSDFIGSADPQGHILYLNQAWRQLLQKDSCEPANRVLITEQHPDWALKIILDEALPTATQQGMWIGETALLDGNGREVPVSQVVIAHKSRQGDIAYFSTIARDISELKQAEKSLKLTQFAVEKTAFGIFWIREDGLLLEVNEAACSSLGYSHHELRGRYVWDINPDLQPHEWPQYWEALIQNIYIRFETYHQTKEGKIFPVEITSNYLEYEGQGFAFSQAQDISDRKAAEAQLQQQAQQLEAANRQLAEYSQTLEQKVDERTQALSEALTFLKNAQQDLIQSEKMAVLGQLTASIAHEINTPLGVIRGASENMRAAFQATVEQLPALWQQLSPQQQTDFLALLQVALQQPQSLSTKEERQLRRQLQAALTAQGLAPAPELATQLMLLRLGPDLHPYHALLRAPNGLVLLQAAYHLVLQHHSTDSIQQEVDRAAKIVFALKTYSHHTDNTERCQVNLVEGLELALTLYHNRLKRGITVLRRYAPELPEVVCNPEEMTQVWINLIDNALHAMGPQGTLAIAVTPQAEHVVVTITDSGQGIPDDLQARIFEPFFTTKARGEGSGLGLDIVRQIVQKHGGTIQVQSQPGCTTFTIRLPMESG